MGAEGIILAKSLNSNLLRACAIVQCLIAPAGTPWDTQGWSPRTLPALPHFNTSSVFLWQMNWWISAGAFDGFAPEEIRISWQIVARSWWLDGWHSWKPKAAILTTTKAWSQSETFGFWFSHDPSKVCPRFPAKSLPVLFSWRPQGL